MIVRSDLPIGFLAAQIVHAAGESSGSKLEPGTNAIVLSVRTEAALAVVARQLETRGIPHVAVHEPDAPYRGALTAIGLAPVRDRALVKPILSKLSLFGKPAAGKRNPGAVV
ncbi:MAG TPA: peptidyl-tRNA hydrolase [Tepidisphaeraceae bacterium]